MTRSLGPAGLFEGEGCITISHSRHRNGKLYSQPRLKLNMVDEDVVRRFHKALGIGHVCDEVPRRSNHKHQWSWYVSSKQDVAAALDMLMPWFGERRRVCTRCSQSAMWIRDASVPCRPRAPPPARP
jgi:LAGLIDADG DNA endonuclease family protein